MNDLKQLNDTLFKALNTISQLPADDVNFNNEKQKAETIYNLADRIIKNNELALRNEVWQSTQRMRITPEIKRISLLHPRQEDDSIA